MNRQQNSITIHASCLRQLTFFMHGKLPTEFVWLSRKPHECCRSHPSLPVMQVVDEAQDGLSKQLRAAMGAARMDEPRGALGSPGMSAAGAGTSTTGAYGQSASASATWYRKGVRDGALREFLREAYHLFCLFYGPLPQLIRAIGVRTARRCLAAFLPDYLTGEPGLCQAAAGCGAPFVYGRRALAHL